LACESGKPTAKLLQKMTALARSSSSPVVRLYLASALQRMEPLDRLDILAALAAHSEDAGDHNLPLMLWYALEPAVILAPERSLALARSSPLPNLQRFVLRRLAAEVEQHELLLTVLPNAADLQFQTMLLEELEQRLRSRRDLRAPKAWFKAATWAASNTDARVRSLAQSIAVAYGDAASLEMVRALLLDASRGTESRAEAISVVARARDAQSLDALLVLLDASELRASALAALSHFDDARIAPAIVMRWGQLNPKELGLAVATLSSRVNTARELFAAIDAGKVQSSCIDAIVARKLADLGDAQVNTGIAKHFGKVSVSNEQKRASIEELKARLSAEVLAKADLANGREIFSRTCQQCHTLFGAGMNVGPDITGSNRADIDYLLSNILDPSAVVAKEYQVTLAWLEDERLFSGIQTAQDEQSLTLQDQHGISVIPRSDIAEIQLSPLSMMPEGQLNGMSAAQVRDLIAYLRSPRQTPLRATAENFSRLFDGRTLAGWKGDPTVFSVEDGAIVGRTAGLDHNAFLHNELELGDFRLVLEVQLEKDAGNSGIQLRSQPLDSGEMRGYQADIGPGWWGALYEEEGRGLLSPAPEATGRINAGGWNTYEIVAVGSRILTAINGKRCVDLDDPAGARRGVLALQVHSGGATVVRVRNMKLELDPKPELTTVGGLK
jgi:putative heme-binding domain-containing protein